MNVNDNWLNYELLYTITDRTFTTVIGAVKLLYYLDNWYNNDYSIIWKQIASRNRPNKQTMDDDDLNKASIYGPIWIYEYTYLNIWA